MFQTDYSLVLAIMIMIIIIIIIIIIIMSILEALVVSWGGRLLMRS